MEREENCVKGSMKNDDVDIVEGIKTSELTTEEGSQVNTEHISDILPKFLVDYEEKSTGIHPLLVYHRSVVAKWEIVEDHPLLKTMDKSIFFCNGIMTPPYVESITNLKEGTSCRSDLPALLEQATPSFFGKGTERVYDENIRKGFELTPRHIKVEMKCDIKVAIRTNLFPTAPNIEIVFSKMAIYQPGGHFDVHRDHVINHDHQGTLLVEVRSEHTGGDLVLCHNGVEHRWSLQDPLDNISEGNSVYAKCHNITDKSVRYIAFHTDIPHRVEPVLSGDRIVLQFDIFITEATARPHYPYYSTKHNKSWTVSEDIYHKEYTPSIFESLTINLINGLQSLVNDQQGIAIPLFHLYTDAELPPNRLKLKDAQVFYSLMKHGYCVQLVPITIIEREDYRGEYENEEDRSDDFIPGFSICPIPTNERGYIRSTETNQEESSSLLDAETLLSVSCRPIQQMPSHVKYIATGYEQVLYLHSTLGGDNIGNEPDTCETHYFCVAFLITTPAVLEK